LNMLVVPTVYHRIEHWREQRQRASLSNANLEEMTL